MMRKHSGSSHSHEEKGLRHLGVAMLAVLVMCLVFVLPASAAVYEVNSMDGLSHAVSTLMNRDVVENTIIITGDFTVTKDISIEQTWAPNYRPARVTLTVPEGESHTLSAGDNIYSMFNVREGGTLTIAENAGGVLTLDGKGKARIICWVDYLGSGPQDRYYKKQPAGILILDGGNIVNSKGNGVFASLGTFYFKKGTISNNAENGISEGNVVMTGGEISGNGWYGVDVRTFQMQGGTISGNAKRGVRVTDRYTFQMQGGTISGNNGGGVSVSGELLQDGVPSFEMTGGEISDNSAETGGGLAVYSGIVVITGGKITNNKATKSGGGMYLGTSSDSGRVADVTVSGSTEISGNSISGSASGYDTVQGGGVAFDAYASGHSFTLAGNAKITGNSVTNSGTGKAVGGGMYMTMGTMSLKDNAVVSGNVADEGADVCLSYMRYEDAVFRMQDAASIAGDVYLSDGWKGESLLTVSGPLTGGGTVNIVSEKTADGTVIVDVPQSSGTTPAAVASHFVLKNTPKDKGLAADGDQLVIGVPGAATTVPTTASTTNTTTVPTTETTLVSTVNATTVPTTEATLVSTVNATTVPTTEATTVPTTEATTVSTTGVTTVPTTEAATVSTTEVTTVPTTEATTISTTVATPTPTPIVATGTVTNPDGVPANYALTIGLTDPAAVPAVSQELDSTKQTAVETNYPNSRIGAVVNVDGSSIDDKINSIDLTFTVEKAWIDENGGVGNVKVLHVKDDGTIETLPATTRDLGNGKYAVTVSGRSFSAFILIVEQPTAVPTVVPTPVRTAASIYSGGGGSTPFVQLTSSYRVPDDSARIDANGTAVFFGRATGITELRLPNTTAGTVYLTINPDLALPEEFDPFMTADLTGPAFSGTAEIRFTVSLAMLSEKEMTADDIAVYQFAQGTWKQLPASLIEEKRGAAYYTAATNSLAKVAIVYQKGGTNVPPTQTPEITPAPTTVPPTAATTRSTTVPTISPTPEKTSGGLGKLSDLLGTWFPRFR